MDVSLAVPFLYQKSGGERVVLEIARRFNAPIHTALYRKETTFREFADLDIREIKQPIFEKPFFFLKKDITVYGSASASLKFLNYRMKDDYDVINAHGTPANWIRNRNERVCWYFYSPVRSAFDLYQQKVATLPLHQRLMRQGMFSWYQFWEKRIDPKLEKTVSVSPYVNVRDKEFLDEYVQKPVEPIPPGVDGKAFRNEGYGKYFLYPSRIIPEKRFEFAIDAFREFCKAKKGKGWKLVIAGFVPDKERDKQYLAQLRKLSEGLDVEFRTGIEEAEMSSLYANSYAILFSSFKEDWGLVPLEAMASEKPCISINEGGPKYSILEGKTGFLVNSPQEMAEKMAYLADHPDENEKMGKAGRKHVLANYTWDVFLKKMENAFKEVAKAKNKD